jgi:hypothetical protein
MQKERKVMRKLIIAIASTAALTALPISAAAAADAQGVRHHHHARHYVSPSGLQDGSVVYNPAVRDGYVMNGNFDWRRLRPGEKRPWYAHGYTEDCVAWTEHAYHYACDPNNRY